MKGCETFLAFELHLDLVLEVNLDEAMAEEEEDEWEEEAEYEEEELLTESAGLLLVSDTATLNDTKCSEEAGDAATNKHVLFLAMTWCKCTSFCSSYSLSSLLANWRSLM